jgi:ABC-type lipoprotein release transport system permease subunit
MAEGALAAEHTAGRGNAARGLTLPIAWRNLWRNKRRTWLTAGAIAFASWLVSFGMTIQVGMYGDWIEITTGLFTGHAEVTRTDFIRDSKLEQTIPDATALMREVEATGDVTVMPRLQGFALVSVGERSFGGLVLGVDLVKEASQFSVYDTLIDGVLPVATDEVIIGETLARNLGAKVGDEIVVLGTAKEGGVAALALTVSGLFNSGQADFDRTFLFTHLSTVQNGFAFGDEAHSLVLQYRSSDELRQRTSAVADMLPAGVEARTWEAVLPDLVQGIELDRVTGNIMYGMVLLLVTFSVVNTFLMIVYERTREFGMLLALGMRPWAIVRLVQLEAAFIWLVGAGLGVAISLLITAVLSEVGIPLEGMEEMVQGMMLMPEAIYPGFSLFSFTLAPLVLLVGTQIAAFVASVRVNWLSPVTALRMD